MQEIGDHPNVVMLFGASYYDVVPVLVLEYCENGDLASYLRVRREMRPSAEILSPLLQFSLAQQVCEGMVCCKPEATLSHGMTRNRP